MEQYKFGAWPNQSFQEADLTTLLYNFTFTYGNGDSYQGRVYARPEYKDSEGKGYSLTYSRTTTDENGLPGTYTITGVVADGYGNSLGGQVLVDLYYDAESNKDYIPVKAGSPVGTTYLGSEYDYIVRAGVPGYLFGGGYYEADKLGYINYRLTQNGFDDQAPRINDLGQMVWFASGDPNTRGVYLSSNGTTTRIFNNKTYTFPDINDRGQVV